MRVVGFVVIVLSSAVVFSEYGRHPMRVFGGECGGPPLGVCYVLQAVMAVGHTFFVMYCGQ